MSDNVLGCYRLHNLLGSGGMGQVFRAYDTTHDRMVALKLLPADLADDTDFRERFRREAHMTARLREPHVIPIHRFGDIDGRLYLDMRLVEGESLRSLLTRRRRLPPARAVAIVSQLAQALDAAHADGLVHRDVKPTNVLLAARQDDDTGGDFAYLIDFGIARTVARPGDVTTTTTEDTPGTYAYMAPERFVNDNATTAAADVYSLACVLFECLTGQRPFPYNEAGAVINAQLNEQPPAVSASAVAVPAALDAVLARGLAKNPAQRFGTAGDFAWAARQALALPAAEPATEPATDPPAEPQPQRRPWWPPVAVAVLGAAAVLAGFVLWGPQPQTPGTAVAVPVRPPGPDNRVDDVRTLLSKLPTGFDERNCHPVSTPALAAARAAVDCGSGPSDGPDHAVFAYYGDGFQLTTAFDQLAERLRLLPGFANQCEHGNSLRADWTHTDDTIGGQLLCYRDRTGAHLAWSDLDLSVLLVTDLSTGDAKQLHTWWLKT